MAFQIRFNERKIVPDKQVLTDALVIGVLSVFVAFLANFFGFDFIFGFLPEGWKILGYVVVGVYVRSLFKV